MPFWVKTVLLGQEMHYYMVYDAYFTELNLKFWDYAQKRRICRENCKYALDERFHGHFCPRRKPAKSCHPGCCYQVWSMIDTMPNIIRYMIINWKYWKCKGMFFLFSRHWWYNKMSVLSPWYQSGWIKTSFIAFYRHYYE